MTDFKAKMHQIRFRLWLRPRHHWGSLQRSPDPLAGFGGRFAAGGRDWAGEEEGKGEGKKREGKWRGGKGRAPSYCWTRAPQSLATPLAVHKHISYRLSNQDPSSKIANRVSVSKTEVFFWRKFICHSTTARIQTSKTVHPTYITT